MLIIGDTIWYSKLIFHFEIYHLWESKLLLQLSPSTEIITFGNKLQVRSKRYQQSISLNKDEHVVIGSGNKYNLLTIGIQRLEWLRIGSINKWIV